MATKPVTDKQVAFLLKLRVERGMEAGLSEDEIRNFTSWDASKTISQLLALPKVGAAAAPVKVDHGIPAGRYAVERDGTLKFFRVDCPKDGKWAGYVFVKVMASDNTYQVRGQAKDEVLSAIMVDPASAAKRYGQEIGKCGICGRTLTDENSRAYGIGPDCREKTGW